MGYCPDCVPTWVACQYCEGYYCDSWQCSGDCLNKCEGEGCNKANCNGEFNNDDCLAENVERQGCVRRYMDGERVHTFCGDCYPGGMVLS